VGVFAHMWLNADCCDGGGFNSGSMKVGSEGGGSGASRRCIVGAG
jgi:hypothetical protein